MPKSTSYKIGFIKRCERPAAFKRFLLDYRRNENLVIEALSQKAMDDMIKWLKSNKDAMDKLSDKHDMPLPRKIPVRFEEKLDEVIITAG